MKLRRERIESQLCHDVVGRHIVTLRRFEQASFSGWIPRAALIQCPSRCQELRASKIVVNIAATAPERDFGDGNRLSVL